MYPKNAGSPPLFPYPHIPFRQYLQTKENPTPIHHSSATSFPLSTGSRSTSKSLHPSSAGVASTGGELAGAGSAGEGLARARRAAAASSLFIVSSTAPVADGMSSRWGETPSNFGDVKIPPWAVSLWPVVDGGRGRARGRGADVGPPGMGIAEDEESKAGAVRRGREISSTSASYCGDVSADASASS